MPGFARDLAQGALDLAYGPAYGQVTPLATSALANVAGLNRSPASTAYGPIARLNTDRNPLVAEPPPVPPIAPPPSPLIGLPTPADLAPSYIPPGSAVPRQLIEAHERLGAPLRSEFLPPPGAGVPPVSPEGVPLAGPRVALVQPPNSLSAGPEAVPRAPDNPLVSPAPSVVPVKTEPSPVGKNDVIPNGLTPEQIEEFRHIPEALPPMKGEIKTQADAAKRADDIINHFASIGNREPIPGAEGALPTITGNSGLATLYRAVRDSDTPVPFTTQENALKANAMSKLRDMAGTEDDLKAAVKNRTDTVDPLYKQAWANKTEADPSGAIKTVEDLMNSPLKQNDTAMAELANIHKKLQGQTDPEQLKGITDHIDETIARLKPEGKADRRTLGALDQVDKAITAEISRTTPGFDAAQATYADLSRRIDEMKYFQGRKLTDLQGNPTLGNMRSTIDDITKKQAGDKFHPADSVTEENRQALQRIHDQMQREADTRTAGKALGSNTFQNLATNTMTGKIAGHVGNALVSTGAGMLTDLAAGGGGMTGALTGAAASGALKGYEAQQAAKAAAAQEVGRQMLMRELRDRLLNIDNKGVAALRGSRTP